MAIALQLQNETKDPNIMVVVTAKNVSEQEKDQDQLVAWKVLTTQSIVFFSYPKSTKVSASFKRDDEVIMSGPFPAEPGSQWKITQENIKGAPILEKGKFTVGP